ncbi:MAG: dihydrofolate reductase [Candidatus Woesebacteria bacterium]|nr:MAG: dihydrofolate reductase [Candidatus Woesebacteria bacterium]
MIVSLIAAVAQNGTIGNKGKIPWDIASDLLRFRRITLNHHVIMGRKTFESIGKPLASRTNIVITRNKDYRAEGVLIAHSLEEALRVARARGEVEAMVIGGAEIYRSALRFASRIYLTRLDRKFEGDAFFPDLDKSWKETITDYQRVTFKRGLGENLGMRFCLLEKS